MFFGMPARILNKKNKPIHAVIGFIGALLKIINIINPTHISVIFDGETGSNRVEVNSDYKANRIDYTEVPDNENPFSQLSDIKKALEYMGIKHCETINVETDDIMAGYANTYGNDMKIVISSSDTDFLQLVNKNVFMFVYRGKSSILYDEKNVMNKFGIKPDVFVDYKSLVGDNSDNIKGVPKIGPKTAVRLINEFGKVESILKHIDEITSKSIKEALNNNKEKLRENLVLIRLNGDSRLPFEVSELEWRNNVEELATMKILKHIDVL